MRFSCKILLTINFLLFVVAARGDQNITFVKAELIIDGKNLKIELAKTFAEQARGLMYRDKISDDFGMLFIYEDEQIRSFWMKNTLIPLSIGFFNKNRELIEVLDMDPVTSELQIKIPSYQSKRPAMYALEVNKGWFVKNKIKLKTKFEIKNASK